MTHDRADFDKLIADKAGKREQKHRPALEWLAQAAVSAEQLMADPHWKVYQQYLAAAVGNTEQNADALRRKLASPLVVDHSEILITKIALAESEAMIRAWNVAISMPKEIMEKGEEAKSVLERLDKVA